MTQKTHTHSQLKVKITPFLHRILIFSEPMARYHWEFIIIKKHKYPADKSQSKPSLWSRTCPPFRASNNLLMSIDSGNWVISLCLTTLAFFFFWLHGSTLSSCCATSTYSSLLLRGQIICWSGSFCHFSLSTLLWSSTWPHFRTEFIFHPLPLGSFL